MLLFIPLGVLLLVPCMGLRLYDSDSAIHEIVAESLRELEMQKEMEDDQDRYLSAQHSSVCYEDLGCFEKNGTFKHLKQLPDTPENVGTQFLLYTRRNPMDPQIIDYKDPDSIFNSNFDKTLPVKVMTHGFGGRNNLTWLFNMKNAFIGAENANIIVVDWSIGAQAPYYIASVVNTELVGAQIAALLLFLKDNLGVHEKNMHAVGFSLGAQVVGFVGKRMYKLRRIKPGRITALDPAAPLFEDHGGEVHVYKDDADFVDVVHTNSDLLLYGGIGIGAAIGHVDYYPNGGKRQPGCKSTLTGVFIDIFTGDEQKACNHERAAHLFVESVRQSTQCSFISHPCANYSEFSQGKCMQCKEDLSDCSIMGYRARGEGNHYLMTVAEKPFCAMNMKLDMQFSEKQEKTKSFGQLTVTLVGQKDLTESIVLSKKDEKLMPGDSKTVVLPLSLGITSLKEVRILYEKFNGWVFKGTENWKLNSISLYDIYGKPLFTHCGEEINLKTGDELKLDTIVTSCK